MAELTASGPLARYGGIVDEALAELDLGAAADTEPLAEAARYSLLAGGKRLRPALCLATAGALGTPWEEALPTALALELVHTFSLVHDDLPALDDDELRRGLPTSHVRYGEDVAILVGDALLALAVELVCERQPGPPERRLAVLSALMRAVGTAGMIGGQYLDVKAPADIDEAGLARLCRLKTGALIEASVACGALVAGADRETESALRAFGGELGLLFQIVDDVLDAIGTDGSLGKPAGSDERHGKRTHVTVLGLERARALAGETHERALARLAEVPAATDDLRALCDAVAHRSA